MVFLDYIYYGLARFLMIFQVQCQISMETSVILKAFVKRENNVQQGIGVHRKTEKNSAYDQVAKVFSSLLCVVIACGKTRHTTKFFKIVIAPLDITTDRR